MRAGPARRNEAARRRSARARTRGTIRDSGGGADTAPSRLDGEACTRERARPRWGARQSAAPSTAPERARTAAATPRWRRTSWAVPRTDGRANRNARRPCAPAPAKLPTAAARMPLPFPKTTGPAVASSVDSASPPAGLVLVWSLAQVGPRPVTHRGARDSKWPRGTP
jgi:hypothetical protein